MDKLTQLVAARLASKRKPKAAHPDSNSLQAFAEGSLLTVERKNMLSHLATCPQCRDVLAYSAPSARAAPQTRWPTQAKWVAATAALLVVTTALWHWAPASKNSVLPSQAHPTPAAAVPKPKSPDARHPFQPDLISSRIVQPQFTAGRSFADGAKSLWQLGSPSGNTSKIRKSTDGGSTWRPVFINTSARLDAISVNGSEIWVGGSNGALFHSADEGVHWVAVNVGNQNMPLKETITGIDMHNGVVTLRTSSATRWSSRDGGSHWRLN